MGMRAFQATNVGNEFQNQRNATPESGVAFRCASFHDRGIQGGGRASSLLKADLNDAHNRWAGRRSRTLIRCRMRCRVCCLVRYLNPRQLSHPATPHRSSRRTCQAA